MPGGLEITDCLSHLAHFPNCPKHTQLLTSLYVATSFPLKFKERLKLHFCWQFGACRHPPLSFPPSSIVLPFGAIGTCTPWPRQSARGRKEAGGAGSGSDGSHPLPCDSRGGHCQAGTRKASACLERACRLAELSLPSLCLLPNESSHTTLKLEGEGHSFIYITQEI